MLKYSPYLLFIHNYTGFRRGMEKGRRAWYDPALEVFRSAFIIASRGTNPADRP
jgi:hypothetical protein